MDSSLPINPGTANKNNDQTGFYSIRVCISTQTSRAYLTPRACQYSARMYFYFTHAYSMQHVHYKQRFKRVTRKHVTGVTIVHAWYHA